MADEVVGSVQVNVHGNTDPLKKDIRQAAAEAGQALDTALTESTGTTLTDHIVGQISDAEKPAGKEAEKVGRAMSRGVNVGMKDSHRDTDVIINTYRRDLDRIGDSLGEMFYESSVKPFQKIREFFSGDGGSIDLGDANITGGGGAGRRAGNDIKKGMLQAGVEKVFLGIALKAATIGPLIAGGIRAAAPLVVGLTGQVAVLGTALAGLGAAGAASLVTMLPAVGALKIAFAGMDAETSKIFKEKLTAASGDLAGFKERVRNEITPALVEATKTVSKLAPEINKLGTDSAKAGGRVAKAFATMLVGRKEEIGNIFGNAPVIMEKFGKSGSKAFSAILNALDALQPLVMRTVNAITAGMDKMSNSLNRSVDSGRFAKTMNEWYDRGVVLMQIFRNLGIVIGRFFGAAADSSDDFLTSFKKVTDEWVAWTGSIEGKNSIKKSFDEAKPVIKEVWGLLGDIAGLFTESFTGDTGNLTSFIQTIRREVIPGIEAFQDTLRESGIQDALFEFGKAILGLFEAGGGRSFKIFLETLTIFVEVVANLTDALGPLLVPLATFFGIFKAMTIAKTAFGGLLGLPGMLTALISPASEAATAVAGVGTAAEGAAADIEAVKRERSRFGRGLDRFKAEAGKAQAGIGGVAIAYGVLATAIQATVKEFDDSAEHIKALTDAAAKGSASLQETGKGIGPNFWEKYIFATEKGTRDFAGEIDADLGVAGKGLDNFGARWKNAWADIGLDWGGVGATSDAIKARFQAFTDALKTGENTGKVLEGYNTFIETLNKSEVDPSNFEDDVARFTDAMDTLKTSLILDPKSGKIDITGLFPSIETGKETFGINLSDQAQKKIDEIRSNSAYQGLKGLTKAGKAAIAAVYREAELGILGYSGVMANTINDVWTSILADPKNLTATGDLTAEATKRLIEAIVNAGKDPKVTAALKQEQTDKLRVGAGIAVPKGVPSGQRAQAAKEYATSAIRLYLPKKDISKMESDMLALFGERAWAIRAEIKADPKNAGATADEINLLLADRLKDLYPKIKIEDETNDIKAKLEKITGKNWEDVLDPWLVRMGMDEDDYIEVDGKLLELTKDGKWQAVIGTEAKTARAEGDIYRMVEQADGTFIKVQVTENGTAKDTQDKIEDEIPSIRPVLVSVSWAETKRKYEDDPRYQWNPIRGQYELKPEFKSNMILPPSEGESSIISPGGPTTMGYADSFTPFAGQRANLVTGRGVMGSPNYWSNKDDKEAKNVTINNYYPEPERASDTVAMSMRVARYS